MRGLGRVSPSFSLQKMPKDHILQPDAEEELDPFRVPDTVAFESLKGRSGHKSARPAAATTLPPLTSPSAV